MNDRTLELTNLIIIAVFERLFLSQRSASQKAWDFNPDVVH